MRKKKKPNMIMVLGLKMRKDGGAFYKKKGEQVWERQ